jgi:hypothetical protein
MRLRLIFAVLSACWAGAAPAAERSWSFDFGQGIGEYAIGSFIEGGSHLALSCAEAGAAPGSASVSLARAGFVPKAATPATFVTDKGKVALTLDTQGSVNFPSSSAPEFRRLWHLLASGRTLRIDYGPGAPMSLPLKGAAKLLGKTVCPRQLAR